MHILGARYLYSNVPYDDWANRFLGISISEHFDWNRNHYHRAVHFMFGILMMLPLTDLAPRAFESRRTHRAVWAFLLIMTISAIYEIVEWLIAILMSPDAAEKYNGQQGDMWDAQKDMALAMLGSFVSAPLVWFRREPKTDT